MADIEFREHCSVALVRSQANDIMICDDARISTDSGSKSDAANRGLIRSLMRERHGTPFEAPQFTFEIEAPIFVAREAHRHRIASISEVSGRYVQLEPVFWVPPRDRPLVQTGKAMDYTLEPGTADQYDEARVFIESAGYDGWDSYQLLLDNGVAKEVARVVLPVSIFTKWRLRINLRSALNFLSLRTRDDRAAIESKPMLEIQEIARGMEDHMILSCPWSMEAFNEFGRNAP